jgi:hypothetical protein
MPLKIVSEDKQRVADVTELKNDITPTENRVVFVEDVNGASTIFFWNPDGDASSADGDTVIESEVDGYGEGGGEEGTWEQGILPVDRADTDELAEGAENQYFESSRARQAVEPDIYESATRLYVDKKTGEDPPINYDPQSYDVQPGRSEARAFATIGRAVEEVKQNIRKTSFAGATQYVTNTPEPVAIFVAAGTYTIDNPIQMPKRISLQGDDLRTTLVFPQNPKADLFHVRSRNFVQLFRFKDIEHPAFSFSFPSAVVETDNIGGELGDARIEYSPEGYECDYENVFSTIYPSVPTDADLPDPQMEGQLISVDEGDSTSAPITIYESVPDGSGGYNWSLFASTESSQYPINANLIIERLKPEAKVSDPRGEDVTGDKDRAQVSITIDNGKVDSISVDDPGSGYVFNPMVSIAAPVRQQPYVIGSPYLYNSSTITGPFTERDENGERQKIPETMPLPYDLEAPGEDPISGTEINRPVDTDGSGGGTKVDGRVTFGANKISQNHPAYNSLPQSPLKSMVAAQFTQVNQGGPGHLLMNDAFGQYVSCFTTFSNYSYRCQSGGFALLSNSVTDFGLEGLVAEGKLDDPYTTATITTDDNSFVSKIDILEPGNNYEEGDTIEIDPPAEGGETARASLTIDTTGGIGEVSVDNPDEVSRIDVVNGGSGYDSADTIDIDPPADGDGTAAEATLEINSGAIEQVIVGKQGGGYDSVPGFTINTSTGSGADLDILLGSQGSGYESVPEFTINTDSGSGAELNVNMDRVATINVEDLDVTTNGNQTLEKKPIQGTAIDVAGLTRDIAGWTERGDGTYDVTFVPGVFSVSAGTDVQLYQSSRINSSGHAFEFPGSGTTYNALPEYGGVTDSSQQTVEVGAGNVFLTASDQRGNFTVGSSFRVNQTTGTVTLDTDQFSLSGLQAIGPFKFAGNEVGVQLQEVSNRSDLTSESSKPGNTVPTLKAVKESFPREVFNVLQDGLVPGDRIDIQELTGNRFQFDFTGVDVKETSDGSTVDKNSAQIIDFGTNLAVTNEDDTNGDPVRVLVENEIANTNDLPEGTAQTQNNLYFTETRAYNANKDQLGTGSDLEIVSDDTNQELTFNFVGDTGAVLNVQQGEPDASLGENGELYIDNFVTRGKELDRTELRKAIQDILVAPGESIKTNIDYENDKIEITINASEV